MYDNIYWNMTYVTSYINDVMDLRGDDKIKVITGRG